MAKLIPANPGFFVLTQHPETGELEKQDPILAWNILEEEDIAKFDINDERDLNRRVVPVCIDGLGPLPVNYFGVLNPDGSVSGRDGDEGWESLDVANNFLKNIQPIIEGRAR